MQFQLCLDLSIGGEILQLALSDDRMPLDRLARAGVEKGERGGSEERAQQSAAAPHAKARGARVSAASRKRGVGSWQPTNATTI